MTGKRLSKIMLCGAVLLSVLPGIAAPVGKAVLPPVREEGFYAIDLPCQITGMAKPGFSDLRIRGGKGREVAYYIREEKSYTGEREFLSFPTEIFIRPGQTDLLIEAAKRPVSSFVLRIKNADTDKTATLKGSNDRENWYAVKDRIFLSQEYDRLRTETELMVDFPLSDYAYYLLSVDDSLSAPLNILSAGIMKDGRVPVESFVVVPPLSVQRKEEGTYTDITLAFPGKFVFREVVFYISSPLYYRRQVRATALPEKESGGSRKFSRKTSFQDRQVHEYGVLDSDGGNRLYLADRFYTDTLNIRIGNGDDQPLIIDSLQVRIPHFVAVAWLYPGDSYVVTYGDETASAPRYDLSFRTKVPDSLPLIGVKEFRELPAAVQPAHSWSRFWKTYGIWLIIGVIIIQILYIVRRITVSSRK